MTKPAITLRATKGLALDYTELDNNFTNLRDATLSVTDGTNTKAFNLNDTVTFTAGTNVTIGVNPTTGAITINSASGVASQLSISYNSAGQVVIIKPTSTSDGIKIGDVTGAGITLDNTTTINGDLTTKGAIDTQPTNNSSNNFATLRGGWSNNINAGASVTFNGIGSGLVLVRNASTGGGALYFVCNSTVALVGSSVGTNLLTLSLNAGTAVLTCTNNNATQQAYRILLLSVF
jgi:hypothetical protein